MISIVFSTCYFAVSQSKAVICIANSRVSIIFWWNVYPILVPILHDFLLRSSSFMKSCWFPPSSGCNANCSGARFRLWRDFVSLQRVVCMGEPLSWRLVEIIMKQLPAVQIMNFYGSTETEARLFWPYQSCLVIRSPMMSIVMNYYEWSIFGAKPSVIFRRSHPIQQCCNSFWAHVLFVWFSVDELWLWGEYHLYGAANSKPLASSICSSCRTTATSRDNPLAATRLLGYQSLRRWDLFWWCDVIRLLGKTWSHCHELCPAPPVGLVVSHRRSWKMATWAAGRSWVVSIVKWRSVAVEWIAGAGTHPAAAGGWLRWCWMCCCGRKGKWPLTDCGFRLSRFRRSRQTWLGSPNSRSSNSAFTTAHAKSFRSTTEATTSFQRKGRLDEFEDLRFRCPWWNKILRQNQWSIPWACCNIWQGPNLKKTGGTRISKLFGQCWWWCSISPGF